MVLNRLSCMYEFLYVMKSKGIMREKRVHIHQTMSADSRDNGFTTLGSTFDVSPNKTSDVPAPSVSRTAMSFDLLIL